MQTIELIYDLDCPNIEAARSQLMKAFSQSKILPQWTEWDRSSDASPAHARQFGSPTILVDGRDVAGELPSQQSTCCRLYRNESEVIQGAPSVEVISAAMESNSRTPSVKLSLNSMRTSSWKGSLATIPGIAFAMLPKLACPACWPAYAGLLSSLGLGFLLETKYLFAMTVSFLLVAVGALLIRARSRRGYRPFFAGVAAAVIILTGKFQFDSDAAMYCGIVLLVAASAWNAWPRRKDASCPSCVEDSLTNLTLKQERSS